MARIPLKTEQLRAIDLVKRWAVEELVELSFRRSDGTPIRVQAAECRIEPHMKAGANDLLVLGACEDGRLFASNTTRDEFGDAYMYDLSLSYADTIKHYMTKNRRCIYWPEAVSQLLRPRDELVLLDDTRQPREYRVAKKSCVWYCKYRMVGMRNFKWHSMPWYDANGEYQVLPPETEPPPCAKR